MVRPSRAQLRALQYLFNHELRRGRGLLTVWRGEGTFEVACIVVKKLANRGLVQITTESSVKRCSITGLGRQAVRKFSP